MEDFYVYDFKRMIYMKYQNLTNDEEFPRTFGTCVRAISNIRILALFRQDVKIITPTIKLTLQERCRLFKRANRQW